MKSIQCLSLQKWPNHLPAKSVAKRKLSPLTSKILALTHTDAYGLMPISLQQFISAKLPQIKDKDKINELYEQEISYRRRKLELLQGIWKKNHRKIISSSSLASSTSETILTSRQLNRSKNLLKSTSRANIEKGKLIFSSRRPVKQSKKTKEKSISPMLYKKDKKKSSQNQYFDGCLKKSKQRSNADESTKSNRKINKHLHNIKRSLSPNQDYYETSINKNSRQTRRCGQTVRFSQSQEQPLYDKVQNLLHKLTLVFEKHRQELEEAKNFSQTEKKRLEKLQKIQQLQIKTQLDKACQLILSQNTNKKSMDLRGM